MANARNKNNTTSRRNQPSQNEFTKRQKHLIRAAVNGNSNAQGNSPSPHYVEQVLTPMNELHLQDLPNTDLLSQELQLNYAASGGKLAAAYAATRQSLSNTSQSNPEMSSLLYDVNGRLMLNVESNSDGEIVRGSPPALRMSKGTPPFKKSTADLENDIRNSLMKGFNTLDDVTEGGLMEGRVPTALKSSFTSRSVGYSKVQLRTCNGKGKPTPSRLPVRSHNKPFLAPQISKPPAMLYRGRNFSNSNTPPNLTRPSLVGANSNFTQVMIESGNIVTVPANLHNFSRNHTSTDFSTLPINTSVYTSASNMMAFQPLSVSQKPLLLPAQKDFPIENQRQEEPQRDEKAPDVSKTRREVVRPRYSGRRSSKGRLQNRRESDTITATESRLLSGKCIGKRKSKLKSATKKTSIPQLALEKVDPCTSEITNGDESAVVINEKGHDLSVEK